jgi:hypothetical protein
MRLFQASKHRNRWSYLQVTSFGPSAPKEESILANSTQIGEANRQDRRAGYNMARGTRTAIYTYLAAVNPTSGIRARPTRPANRGQPRLFVRPVGSTVGNHTHNPCPKFLGLISSCTAATENPILPSPTAQYLVMSNFFITLFS